MAEYLRMMGERETHQTREIFYMALESGGISGITWDEVLEYNEGVAWLCNNHVFRAMKAKGLLRENIFVQSTVGLLCLLEVRKPKGERFSFRSLAET
jgi:hypothetical protein